MSEQDTFRLRMAKIFVVNNYDKWIEDGSFFEGSHIDKTIAFSVFMLKIHFIRMMRTVKRALK